MNYIKYHPNVPKDIRDEVDSFLAGISFDQLNPFSLDPKDSMNTLSKNLYSKGYIIRYTCEWIEVHPLYVAARQILEEGNKDAILKSFRDHGFSNKFIRMHIPELLEL